jgi:hypothetical protein
MASAMHWGGPAAATSTVPPDPHAGSEELPMTTYAPNDAALDERVRQAWAAYRDSLTELQGRQYDVAEAESWDLLQEALRDIEDERSAPPPDA